MGVTKANNFRLLIKCERSDAIATRQGQGELGARRRPTQAKEENEGRVACGAKRRRKCARGGNGEKLGCTPRADAYTQTTQTWRSRQNRVECKHLQACTLFIEPGRMPLTAPHAFGCADHGDRHNRRCRGAEAPLAISTTQASTGWKRGSRARRLRRLP